MKHLERIYYVVLFAIAVVIMTGTSILTADIGWEVVKSAQFYITILLNDVAIVCITFGTIYTVLDKFKEKNQDYLDADKTISDFAKSKENVPSILSRFLETLNYKRKLAQYKFNLQKKLHDLTAYKPLSWKILPWHWGKTYYTDEDIHIWNYGTEEEKKNNAYCRKRFYLEEQLSDDFIEKNLSKIQVNYKQVTDSIILGGYYNKAQKNGPNDFIEGNLSAKIVSYKVPRLFVSFGFIFLISSIVFDAVQFNVGGLINLATKIGTIVWNAYTAMRYAKRLSNTVVLKDIRFRVGIITEYRKWIKQEATQKQERPEEEIKLLTIPEENINDGRRIDSITGGDSGSQERSDQHDVLSINSVDIYSDPILPSQL